MDVAGQNAVDDALVNLLADEDPVKLGAFMALLVQQPVHYQKMAALRSVPRALLSYVDTTLQAIASSDKSQASVSSDTFSAGAWEEVGLTDEERADQMLTDEERADQMLTECRDRWGTHIRRLEESGVLPKFVLQGVKNGTAGVACGASAAAAAATAAAHVAKAVAQNANTAAQVQRAMSVVALFGGDPVSFVMCLEAADASMEAAAVSMQLARQADTLAKCSKWAGRAGVVLTIGVLGYEFYSNIRQYYLGEIDGYKCSENLTAAALATGAGIGGGMAGVALCAGAGPAGLLFAALAGSIMAAGLTRGAVSLIFKELFGSDRERSVKTAFGILGLKEDASPEEIRKVYLRLALEHHPDKGGNTKKFIEINSAYELIRASKLASK